MTDTPPKRIIEGELIKGIQDCDSGRVWENIEFRNCEFADILISMTNDPKLRSTFRNVNFINCTIDGGTRPNVDIYTAIFDNVLIENLKSRGGLIIIRGAVFRRVILKGRIPPLMIQAQGYPAPSDILQNLQQADVEFYSHVDWAFDISQAQLSWDFEVKTISPYFFIRDPESQVIVTHERMKNLNWRDTIGDPLYYDDLLDHVTSGRLSHCFVFAPKASTKYRRTQKLIDQLRAIGAIEE